MIRFCFAAILIFGSVLSRGQCPATGFTFPATACASENVLAVNTAAGADTYAWDFCSGDLAITPSVASAVADPLFFRSRVFRTIQANGVWYGFAINQPTGTLVRFRFGSSLENTPVVTSLGNPGGFLNNPLDIKFLQEGTVWIALVANTDNNSVVRLTFEAGIESAPTAQNLGTFGGALKFPAGIEFAKEGNDVYAFVTNSSAAEIVRLYFGSSLSNTPTETIVPVAGAAPRSIAFVRECDRWFGVITSYTTNELFYLDFNNGLGQLPSTGVLNIPSASYSFPATIRISNEGSSYYAYIQSAFPADVYRINFGASIIDRTGSFSNLGNLGISTDNAAFELTNEGSRWYGFSIDLSGSASPGSGRLMRMTFPNNCNASTDFYVGEAPPAISYASGGTHQVTQQVKQGANTASLSRSVVVSASLAPDINFTSQNNCSQHDIVFNSTNTSGNISSYSWDFDDGGGASVDDPVYQYANAGEYKVRLTVTATNGCQNALIKPLTVFNVPQADFALPTMTANCTNQMYVFENTSVADAGSSPTWQWQLDGANQVTTEDSQFSFTQTRGFDITLIASIPGCSSQTTKTFNVTAVGPLVDFVNTMLCQTTPITFTNQISGAVTSTVWDFGDGNGSSQPNPIHTFASKGTYEVTLTATNAAGCENFVRRPLMVRSQPQPDFTLDLPPFSCSNNPSQFHDATPAMPDSNISSWAWAFGDPAASTASVRDPSFTYTTAANYQVTLTATSNFGCSNSIQKTVTIQPSPAANFSLAPACTNQGTQFTDLSTGAIKSWMWNIQGTTYSVKDPVHVFNSPGNHTALLTVTGINNCVSQVSRTISVPALVSPNFIVQSPCATKPSVFQEVTLGGPDPAVSWDWDFAGQPGSGSPAQHTFASTGNYTVRMSTTRQSGCVYSVTKTVSIGVAPVAQFTVPAAIGAPPFSVAFTNTSTNADSYLWKFGDPLNTTSTSTSPSFTYNQVGIYLAELRASNSLGCSDDFSKLIQAVIPQVNGALTDFRLTNFNNAWETEVTVVNRSNVPIINPDIYINISGRATISEKIEGILLPGQHITKTLAVSLGPVNFQYACAELRLPGDVSNDDDRQCVSVSDETLTLSPSPNPATDKLSLEWINDGDESMRVVIYNVSGQVVFDKVYTSLSIGLQRIEMTVSNLLPGIYFASFQSGSVSKSHRFSIVR